MERLHAQSHCFAHAPHLPVASFVDRDLDRAVLLSSRERAHATRSAPHAGLELDAARQPLDHARRRHAIHAHAVHLLDSVPRMHEVMGELTVVGEQQQPARVGVEPAHRKHPRAGRQELGDRAALLGIVQRADHADRLVEHEVAERGARRQRTPAHGDAIAVRLHLGARLGDHAAVHLHRAFLDQRVALAPRAEPALRQELVEADAQEEVEERERFAAPGASSKGSSSSSSAAAWATSSSSSGSIS